MFTLDGFYTRELASLADAGNEEYAGGLAHVADHMEETLRFARRIRDFAPHERRHARVDLARRMLPVKVEIQRLEAERDRHVGRIRRTPPIPKGEDPLTFDLGTSEVYAHMRRIGPDAAGVFAMEWAGGGDAQVVRALMRAPDSLPLVRSDVLDDALEAFYGTIAPESYREYRAADAVASSLRTDFKRLVRQAVEWELV